MLKTAPFGGGGRDDAQEANQKRSVLMMKQEILTYKTFEYTGLLGAARYLKSKARVKKLSRMLLVLYRLRARASNQKILQTQETIRLLEREKKKMAEAGISFPLVEPRLERLREDLKAANADLVDAGDVIGCLLDLWQSAGAAFKDLCNLCNRDPVQVKKELEGERLDQAFSELVMVHNLDYKNPHDTGWLEDEVDAPLTHALNASLLEKMLSTKEGREAAHQAMQAVFPEIMENAMTLVTDADGNQVLIDKDGVTTPVLDREEGKK